MSSLSNIIPFIISNVKVNNYWTNLTTLLFLPKQTKIKNFFLLLGYYYVIRNSSKYLTNKIYRSLKLCKPIRNMIQKETSKIILDIKKDLHQEVKTLTNYHRLPGKGVTKEFIISEFEKMKELYTFDYQKGRVSGAVYSNNEELDKLLLQAYPYFTKSNPLHTNVFPAIRKMENDIVKMMIHLFQGNDSACGTFTSGGTESILLACKTYRDKYQLTNPNIIVSSTAHCAFKKACQYFKIEYLEIPCLPNGLLDTKILQNTINKNTILVVASAPSYNLGLIDPIEQIAKITTKYDIGLHVDCCMGAFLINFINQFGGFKTKGVTSISADIHKYGNSPKGASTILYHNKELLQYQYFIDEEWSGGVYATSTIAGSKSGNIVALTWITLLYNGMDFYQKTYQTIMSLREYFIQKLYQIDKLYVYGEPELNIIAIGSNHINMNILGEELKKKKWNINMIQKPGGFHFCLTSYHNNEIIDTFFNDMIELIKTVPSSKSKSKCIYGTMESINDNEIVKDVIVDYLHLINAVI